MRHAPAGKLGCVEWELSPEGDRLKRFKSLNPAPPHTYSDHVRCWQILLQKALMASANGDSLALTRFAVEADDDGTAES